MSLLKPTYYFFKTELQIYLFIFIFFFLPFLSSFLFFFSNRTFQIWDQFNLFPLIQSTALCLEASNMFSSLLKDYFTLKS